MSDMTKDEFKTRWESNENGGGITFDDVAECAKEWGLYTTPRIKPMGQVLYAVLRAAKTVDAEEFDPEDWGVIERSQTPSN